MAHQRKIHYANDSWSSAVCGAKVPTPVLTWRLANVTCGACRKNKIYLNDVRIDDQYKEVRNLSRKP